MKKILMVIAALCGISFATPVSVAQTVHDTAGVLRSEYKITARDSARKISQDTAKKTVADSLHSTGTNVTFGSVKFGTGVYATAAGDTGSFLDTITGMSTVPTATIKYSYLGNRATLIIPAQTGTSNTTSCTIKTLPAAIRPLTQQEVVVTGIEDNGAIYSSGFLQISTAGVLTFFVYTGISGAPTSTTTATGTKGFTRQTVVTYQISP